VCELACLCVNARRQVKNCLEKARGVEKNLKLWYNIIQEEKIMKELDRITVDPEICLGQPTIRGMRITVSVILKQLASGMTQEEILKAYPELEKEDIVQVIKYAAWLSSEKAKVIPVKEVTSV
jgi:uncharacterized protein (DUF433 family)